MKIVLKAVVIPFQATSGSSDESESVPFIDDDSSESSSKDKTDNAASTTATMTSFMSATITSNSTPLPKPTFLDLKQGKLIIYLRLVTGFLF